MTAVLSLLFIRRHLSASSLPASSQLLGWSQGAKNKRRCLARGSWSQKKKLLPFLRVCLVEPDGHNFHSGWLHGPHEEAPYVADDECPSSSRRAACRPQKKTEKRKEERGAGARRAGGSQEVRRCGTYISYVGNECSNFSLSIS